ncbi:MAG: VOC family protein [Verrucomicrobiota bacterium]
MKPAINRRTFVAGSAVAGLGALLRSEAQAEAPTRSSNLSGLHHIGIFSSDPDVTIRFFINALNFKLHYKWPLAEGEKNGDPIKFTLEGAMLDGGNGNFVEVFPRPSGTESQSPVFPLNHFAIRTSDIEASYQQAIENGGKPHSFELEGSTWDGTPLEIEMLGTPKIIAKIAFLRGPDDLLIELFESSDLLK